MCRLIVHINCLHDEENCANHGEDEDSPPNRGSWRPVHKTPFHFVDIDKKEPIADKISHVVEKDKDKNRVEDTPPFFGHLVLREEEKKRAVNNEIAVNQWKG